jgi:hypothetical protein
MRKLETILNEYGQKAVSLLKEKIAPYRATGKTEESLRYEVTGDAVGYRLTVYGRKFFKAIETGRGERKSSDYSGFDKALDDWMRAKGFRSKTSKTGNIYYQIGDQWYSAKSLAWKINKEGDKTYREGGRQVYSDALNELISELKQSIKDSFKNDRSTT